jgi:hypothetical protein
VSRLYHCRAVYTAGRAALTSPLTLSRCTEGADGSVLSRASCPRVLCFMLASKRGPHSRSRVVLPRSGIEDQSLSTASGTLLSLQRMIILCHRFFMLVPLLSVVRTRQIYLVSSWYLAERADITALPSHILQALYSTNVVRCHGDTQVKFLVRHIRSSTS